MPTLADGAFVQVADMHLDVPLFWQCWKLESPMIKRSPTKYGQQHRICADVGSSHRGQLRSTMDRPASMGTRRGAASGKSADTAKASG